MLFDLRSRGRRRTVQAVYLGLAILMGGGLILFGVGTGVSGGGLLNAFGGGSSNQKQVISQEEKTALAQVKANPNDPQGWGALLQARWTSAGQGNDFNQTTGTFTAAGNKELAAATQAWQRYLQLVKTPDPNLTILAARAYAALGNYAGAASAWEQETLASPNQAKGYECLAVSAYAAKQTRKADLASAKALTLLPKAQQLATKQTFQQAKSSAQTAAQIAAQC
jgi:tetratricopeptide (TPR) repeat protein